MFSLQQFTDNYVPNCLICNKKLIFILNGGMLDQQHHLDIKLNQKNNILFNDFYNIKINIQNNLFNDNFLLNKKNIKVLELIKRCMTCTFDLVAYADLIREDNWLQIQNFYLSHEIVKFTAPKINKNIEIINLHSKNININNKRTIIYINGKDLNFDESFLHLKNIKNFSELKKKTKTMLLFG